MGAHQAGAALAIVRCPAGCGHGENRLACTGDTLAPDEAARGLLHGKKVLLAEDNDIDQIIAVQLLAACGMEVTVAANGAETLRAAAKQHFDVILMNIQMPEMDGLEAATQLRRDARLDSTPIIAMTAHAMAGDHEKSLAAGMQGHVTKPIDPEQLYATLVQWVVEGSGWRWQEGRGETA